MSDITKLLAELLDYAGMAHTDHHPDCHDSECEYEELKGRVQQALRGVI